MKAWTTLRRCCALTALSAALVGSLFLSPGVQAADAKPVLTLESLYRAEDYRGQLAREASFSHSGRYLAYLWNPFGEPGADLHVYDTKTGKTLRLTSRKLMAAYDAPEDLERFDRKLQQRREELAERQAREVAQQAYLRGEPVDMSQWERAALETLKKELAEKKTRDDAQKAQDKLVAEAEKRAADALAARRAGKPEAAASAASAPAADKSAEKAAEKELWELRDELKKKLEKNKLKPSDLYPGVSQLVWAHKRDELVFQYRGQLFRWQAGQERVQPLVAMQRPLRLVAYAGDDQGLFFTDEQRVLRIGFANAGVQIVNRELIHGDDEEKKYKIEQTTLSEDGRWMSLLARAPLTAPDGKGPAPKPGRQVDMTDYSGRFAVAKKIDREVSDDKRMEQPLALYIRKVPGLEGAPTRQPKPVFTHPGGDVWFEISPIAWARDGSHYAFATFEREKELLRVYLGKADENAKPEMILERRGDVHHELVNVQRPQFTPDGKQLVLMLADADWRQPYAYELASKQLRPLVHGAFEAFDVLGFSPDSQQMFVLSNKDELAAMNLWRVSMKSGQMQRLGQAGEYHRGATVSDDGQWLAANAGNWGQRPELKLYKGQAPEAPKTLTQSHDPAFDQVHVLQPQRFSFKNRHGDELQAYVFKPQGWQASDKRPAVVYVYGGPLNARNTVEVDSFQPTGYLFGMYMAAKHGYVTVSIDTRGHSNYGRRFADANFGQPGQPQTEDLLDLVAYMKANLGVDAQRIGLNGWSFGGFQTQYTMYTQPDVFAAGIAGAGPTEWENYNSWYTGRTIGKVDRTKPVLRKYSLLPLARGLKHPLMLVHGMQDDNVLYQDTVNVYRALLESGKESLVELFLDPDGAHAMGGVVKPAAWHRKYEAFWLQHLGRAQ